VSSDRTISRRSDRPLLYWPVGTKEDRINQRSYVPLKVTEAVRTDTGLDGTIVSLTDDGIAAFVQATENGKSDAVVRYRLDRLTKVEDATRGAV
jgi:hypothetical protein